MEQYIVHVYAKLIRSTWHPCRYFAQFWFGFILSESLHVFEAELIF